MEQISCLTEKRNPVQRSADTAEATPLNRVALATALAQAAFGANYAPPADADFLDRTPSEIAAIRFSMGLEAAR